ncbi:hypothetical protein CWC17_13415 [Pseudoalteromonas sp. S3785]|nr:hypothetical protein CWC17_13415 [Pseudoalteromonas sp. S3785]
MIVNEFYKNTFVRTVNYSQYRGQIALNKAFFNIYISYFHNFRFVKLVRPFTAFTNTVQAF